MKNKLLKVDIILFIVFIILLTLIAIEYYNNDNNNITSTEKEVVVEDWNFVKEEKYYVFNYVIENNIGYKISSIQYKMVFLDDKNNLLYTIDNFNFDPDDSSKIKGYIPIYYDIANVTKSVLILKSSEDIKYNKDISGSIKYLGDKKETTTTTATEETTTRSITVFSGQH